MKNPAPRVELFGALKSAFRLLNPQQRIFYSLIVGARLGLNVLDVAGVAALGILGAISASALSGERQTNFLGFELQGIGPKQTFPILFVVLGLFTLKALFSILLTRATALFLARLEIQKSVQISREIFSGPIGDLQKYSKSEAQFAVTQSTHALFSGLLGGFSTLVVESALLVSIFALFLWADWLGALAVFAYFIAIVITLQTIIARKFVTAGGKITEGGISAGATILEIYHLFRDLAVLGKRDFFLSKFERAKKKQALASASIQVLNAIPRLFIETALIVGAIGFLAWQVSRADLGEALTALAIFLAGGARAIGALIPIQTSINNLQVRLRQSELAQSILLNANQSSTSLSDLFREHPEGAQDSGQPPRTIGGYPFSLAGVTYRYPEAEGLAVKSVTLSGAGNSLVAIIGSSGAGKSTIADLLLGIAVPTTGTIEIGGLDPAEITQKFPGTLGYVPQRPGLIHGSIAENVALGVEWGSIDRERVREVIELSQLTAVVEALPDGIDADLGKHADSLSGGQLQRIGLARALYAKPRLVVLDEATSALDAETESEIVKAIATLRHECTFIVIAHRLSTVQKADIVYVLEDGALIAQGTFSEVRKAVPQIESNVQLMSFPSDSAAD